MFGSLGNYVPTSVVNRIGSAASTIGLSSEFSQAASVLGIGTGDPTVDPQTDNGTLTESGTIRYPAVSTLDKWFSYVYVDSKDPPGDQKKARDTLYYISGGALLLLAIVGRTYHVISQ